MITQSPRWRANNEGRPHPLAMEIAERRWLRGCSWQVGYEARRALDDLRETLQSRFEAYLGDGGPVFDSASLARLRRDLEDLLQTREPPIPFDWADPQ